ncbi:hypothetical protein LCGC14_0570340 [marine sediment metagenome]|uniref:Phage head morphogenesis domain-containing protein n=1 Tax=marine sediment metagenome TaxID=412755 RepID=A0A0F9S310_9ZZZZ|nr:hypothetical protein [Pricia sp.]
MPKTANETFRDFFLRRQHFIQRYENGVLRDMALSFRQAYPELQARMLNLQNVIPAPGTGFTQQFRIQRMRAQLADMQGIMNTAAINSSNHLTQALADFAHAENQAIAGMYAQQFGKVGIDFMQLPFRQIDSILQEPLIWQRRGIGIADVMLENVDKAMARIRGELTQSIILGEDMAQAAKRLTGTVGRFTGLTAKQLARRTEVIARSEIQNVAAQVSRQITQENNDVLKSVVFTATLDSRTCKQCMALDGGVYRLDPKTGAHNGPLIPIHPMCRCLYIPQSYSWQELAKRNNVPFDKRQKAFFDGAVTKTITYDAWLKTLSTAEQVEILGLARQRLWSSGQIKLNQMATSKRILTIEQLEAIAERELGKKVKIPFASTTKGVEKVAIDNNIIANPKYAGAHIDLANATNEGINATQKFFKYTEPIDDLIVSKKLEKNLLSQGGLIGKKSIIILNKNNYKDSRKFINDLIISNNNYITKRKETITFFEKQLKEAIKVGKDKDTIKKMRVVLSELKATKRYGVASGFPKAGDVLNAIHETTHAIVKKTKSESGFRGRIIKALKKGTLTQKDIISVSGYSLVKHNELLAETVTLIIHKGRKSIPKNLLFIFDDWFDFYFK